MSLVENKIAQALEQKTQPDTQPKVELLGKSVDVVVSVKSVAYPDGPSPRLSK